MVQIKRIQEEEVDIIAPVGEIDASSSIELDLALAKSVSEGYKKIVVDCSSLEYISSAGLGVFMSYIEEMHDARVAMVLFGLNPKVAHTFQILGLADLLNLVETKEEAKKKVHDISF